MSIAARYAHTNLVARDWRALVKFYVDVFGCAPVGPQRRARGQWVEDVTAVPGAEVDGVHLRLPGHGETGPTLEIFQYHRAADRPPTALNRPGFAHIAFEVEDVESARAAILAAGGRDVGKLVTTTIPGAGTITLIYMADPEGNVIEFQKWTK